MRHLTVFLTLCVLCAGCAQQQVPQGELIVATFFPLAEITSAVAGNTASVQSIVPVGVEPHDYEPTPGDMADFQRAAVFVTVGLEFENIEEKLLVSRSTWPVVVDATGDVELLPVSGEEEGLHVGATEAYDPHVWLSPINMMIMTRSVQKELSAAYPQNAVLYKQNADNYVSQLEALDMEYRTKLSSCRTRTLLVSHQAFGYLAHDYNLEQLAIGGLSPDTEPTPGQMVELVETAREHGVKYLFTEELIDPRVAQTIAMEVGAQTLLLSPAEGSKNPEDTYISVMRRNLDNLRVGLECS